MPYATKKEKLLAESLGYQHTSNTDRGTHFNNQHRNIWGTYTGWQTADLLKGYYRNHLHFKYLHEALAREL